MAKQDQDSVFMQKAINMADKNMLSKKGGPFGAIITRDSKIIAQAGNTVNADNDPTAHAEVNVIRLACKKLKTSVLEGCTLYTSCEPCPMCLSAIYWSKVSLVYYGNTKTDSEWAGFGDMFLYEEIAKGINERTIPFKRLLPNQAILSFEKWLALSDEEKEEIKNGSL